ncbi:hypothetical protein ACJMK2_034967 [Sinanodonta woodiana]|uniref:Uncharacterized protein n=1 Tax=Sinanodonta woodiana TaxID=1069815 RepID=A0ABD3WTC2_SINWO
MSPELCCTTNKDKRSILVILCYILLQNVSSSKGYKYEDGISVLTANFLDASYLSPRLRPQESTTVNVSLNLLAVVDVDMKSQTVTTAGWLNVVWSVPLTQWSVSSYDMDTVYLKDGDVWQPSLVAWNGASTSNFIGDDRLLVRAIASGLHFWEPPFLLKTHCQMDATYFPFDSQKCSIVISSWGMTETEVPLNLLESNIKLTYYEENAEWSLDKSKCSVEKRVVSETNYGINMQRSRLYFNIVLQRRSSFYGLYIFLPTIILSFLSVISFAIPSSSGDKMSYAATIILAHFLGLAAALTVIPDSSQIPLIAIYVILNLVLSATTIFMCAVISAIHHRDPNIMVSPVCRSATGIFASVTCTDRSAHSNETDLQQLVKVKVVAKDDQETRENGVDFKEASKSHENGGIIALEKYPQPLPPLDHRFRKNKIVPKSAVSVRSGKSITDAENVKKWQDVAKIWDTFFFRLFLIAAILFHFSFIIVIARGNNA